jgi:hypothetical protein
MPRIKRKTYAGSVCEQEVYSVPDRIKNLKAAELRQRFKNEEERQRHRKAMAKRNHRGTVNATYGAHSLYTTVTLDNEHEVHTLEEGWHIGTLFLRRLKYVNPAAQIMLYMGRGKSTNRIHFHMLSNGLTEEVIKIKWQAGSVVRIEQLREHNYYNGVDYGQDYSGLADYLFDHWTPEQGKNHYRGTKNLCHAEREAPKIIKRVYSESKPPRPPKGYKLVESKSNQFGYLYFKYVRIVEKSKPPNKRRPMKC